MSPSADPPEGKSPETLPAAGRPQGAPRGGLFVIALGSGFAILTIEIAGARDIASYTVLVEQAAAGSTYEQRDVSQYTLSLAP